MGLGSSSLNDQLVHVRRFDGKNRTWVNCSTLDVGFIPKLNGSFLYQGDVYAIVQDLKSVYYSADHKKSGGEAGVGYQECYRFDISTKSLLKVDMEIPANPTFSVIPAHYLD